MKFKKAFSLAEVLISLSVIAAMYVIMLPSMKSNAPKDTKILMRKAYGTIEKAISSMINDDSAYPYIDLGFAYTTTVKNGSYNKFCYYFIDSLNTIEDDYSNCKAKSSDGIDWAISNVNFALDGSGKPTDTYNTTITVDVNGNKAPNCSYSGACKSPDRFSVKVRYDGKIKLEDSYVIDLLKNPLNTK